MDKKSTVSPVDVEERMCDKRRGAKYGGCSGLGLVLNAVRRAQYSGTHITVQSCGVVKYWDGAKAR